MSKLNGMWIGHCKDGEKISIIFLIVLKTITLFDKISSLYKEWLWSTSQWAEGSECVIHLYSTCWLTSRELFLYFILILSKISQFHSLSISGKMYLCHSFIPSPSAYAFIPLSFHACIHPVHFMNCFTPRRVLIKMWLIYSVKTWTNKQKSSPNTQGCIKNREQGDREEVPITRGTGIGLYGETRDWLLSRPRFHWEKGLTHRVPCVPGEVSVPSKHGCHFTPPVILRLMMKLM